MAPGEMGAKIGGRFGALAAAETTFVLVFEYLGVRTYACTHLNACTMGVQAVRVPS
jgi:hypothetical protein